MDSLAVTLLVIMLPGIISAVIADKIITHQKWSSFKFMLYAFLLGVGCYALLQLILWVWNLIVSLVLSHPYIAWKTLNTWQVAETSTPSISAPELISASVLSIAIAFIAAYLINHKVINRLAQKFGVSIKYGDENLFSYFLNAEGIDWIYIRDIENGLTYQGRIVSFSETDAMQEIVLQDVSVFSYNESLLLYEIPSIYLIKEMGKFIIEVIPFELLEEPA